MLIQFDERRTKHALWLLAKGLHRHDDRRDGIAEVNHSHPNQRIADGDAKQVPLDILTPANQVATGLIDDALYMEIL